MCPGALSAVRSLCTDHITRYSSRVTRHGTLRPFHLAGSGQSSILGFDSNVSSPAQTGGFKIVLNRPTIRARQGRDI